MVGRCLMSPTADDLGDGFSAMSQRCLNHAKYNDATPHLQGPNKSCLVRVSHKVNEQDLASLWSGFDTYQRHNINQTSGGTC